MAAPDLLWTVNTGSSSLKAAVFHGGPETRRAAAVVIDRIGLPGGSLRIEQGEHHVEEKRAAASHREAFALLLDWLRDAGYAERIAAVGHRVVHGGSRYHEPQLVTADLVAALRNLIPLDPEHLPQCIAAIETLRALYPGIPQVACFDTAFHRRMPAVAQTYALPRRFKEHGVQRYGFHGLSYEYIMQELQRQDATQASVRLLIAHLGNGASMAAVSDGHSVDTTMGFTPAGGLVMSTRSGDLDPGVLLYLLQNEHMTAAQISDLVNKQSGLLGVSGASADMQDLLGRQRDNPHAAAAVELFCYQAAKLAAGLIAALGGLDTLVFTAGIGEHAPEIRERICARLRFAGVEIDPARNTHNDPIISPSGSSVTVRVMATDEDAMIARHTYQVVAAEGEERVPV